MSIACPSVRVACMNEPVTTHLKNTIKTQIIKAKMGEELPILKGILKGNVNYHNARKLSINR